MSPAAEWEERDDDRFPRVSGDEPLSTTADQAVFAFSPRERG